MDYRCLYGHRTPSSFGFAIEQGSCPVCGAPLVSVVGYQVARKLASDVPLDPVLAFNTVRCLEKEYALTPLTPEDDEPAEVSVAEIEIDESEAEVTQAGADQSEAEVVVQKPAPAASEPAKPKKKATPVAAPAPALELPSETEPPPPVTGDEKPVEDSLSDVEKAFFS